MRSSQIKWLDMKTERIALSSSIGLTVIALLIKQWGNSSFASRHIDMLTAKMYVRYLDLLWDLCFSVKTSKAWCVELIQHFQKTERSDRLNQTCVTNGMIQISDMLQHV